MNTLVKRIAVNWPSLLFGPIILVGGLYGASVGVFEHYQWRAQKAGLVNYCSEEHPEVFQHCLYQECMIDTAGSTRCKEFRRRVY